jgi:RNA polymerase sigma-70 factor (ECF subfamily)
LSDVEWELIHRVRTGHAEAFRTLVLRYQQPVFRFVGNLVVDHHEIEDLVQDVFLTAYEKISLYDPSQSKFTTWLFVIARNKSINWLRRKRHRTGTADFEPVDYRHDGRDDDESEFFMQLDRALAALPVAQRTAFVLAEIEELPYDEIARIEGTRLGTVKSRVHRAKTKLRSLLQRTTEHF